VKVGIYSPYWDTLGGGERYIFTVAEFFEKGGHKVNIFNTAGKVTIDDLEKKFGMDLKNVTFVENIFAPSNNIFQKIFATNSYDLIFFLSDGSLPLSFAKKNILHFQAPFNLSNQRTLLNKIKLIKVSSIVCNSQFTKEYIDKTYGVSSKVLYPPVDINSFAPSKKGRTILSIGRFFSPSHPKKQEEMVKVFKKMVDGGLSDWKLNLIGGINFDSGEYVKQLRELSIGYPIEIITDSDFKTLQTICAQASIYWHAAGFGEDLEKHPEKAEHFGISTVEAMAAGAVPVVFEGGGQKEIVVDGECGLFWQNEDELITKTLDLISDSKKLAKLSANAKIRAKNFSKQKFFENLKKIST